MISKIIYSKKGESIMEALVSMLILGMLLVTVMAIIQYSMIQTAISSLEATEAQDRFNGLIIDEYDDEDDITVNFQAADLAQFDIDVTHDNVVQYTGDGLADSDIVAFHPFTGGP
jgi:Na+-driven multidrug efflux pump